MEIEAADRELEFVVFQRKTTEKKSGCREKNRHIMARGRSTATEIPH
jgi:hypothetical protein